MPVVSTKSANREPLSARGQRTRALLLEAAREVFERDGYVDARVADIAALAQVSHGTFYTYFDSKQDVFRELMQAVSAALLDGAAVEHDEEPGLSRVEYYSRRVRRSNDGFLDAYRINRKLVVLYEQVATIDPDVGKLRTEARRAHVQHIARGIKSLQAHGLVDRELDARTAAAALAAMVGNFAYQWLGLGVPFEAELASETLHRLWLGALGLSLPQAR